MPPPPAAAAQAYDIDGCRGDPSPVSGIWTVPPILCQTVGLIRFYNIITTINTIFLESLSDESGIRTHADCSTRLGGLVGFDGIVRG